MFDQHTLWFLNVWCQGCCREPVFAAGVESPQSIASCCLKNIWCKTAFCFPPYKLSHHLHQGISCVGSFLEQNMSSGLSVLKYEMQVALSKQPIPSCPQNSRTFYIRTQTRRFRCHPPGLPQIVTQQLTQADSKP